MALIEASQLPEMDLFGIFMAHFIFSTWGILGTWSPDAYLYYNAIFLIITLWCLKDAHNEVPLILGIRVNAISIIFDFLILIWYFPYHFWKDILSFIGGIINFLLRFVTVPLLSKICSERSAGTNDGLPHYLAPMFGSADGTTGRDPYEDIDDVPHQSYPRTTETVIVTGTHSYTPKNPPPYQG